MIKKLRTTPPFTPMEANDYSPEDLALKINELVEAFNNLEANLGRRFRDEDEKESSTSR